MKNAKLNPKKIPSSWEELAKSSPKIFKKYGGGGKYLKEERSGWETKRLV